MKKPIKSKSGINKKSRLFKKAETVLSAPLIFSIRLYRKYISPIKKPSCRFMPTCSVYAIEALKEWGPIAGSVLAVWRILRCNPFSRGGYDPVPERGKKKGKKAD